MTKKIQFSRILMGFMLLIWIYSNSLIDVSPVSKEYLKRLKKELILLKYDVNLFVISGRRYQLDNWILNKFGGAAPKSKHLKGEAIDVIILDINRDGKADSKDVDIVFKILSKKIIKNKGGIGTYKKQEGFFNRQMIHFDCRGKRARWKR